MSLLLNYFDLETCPRPISELQMVMPEFSAPSHWKDEDKIRDNIEEQKAKWIDNATLSALTGEILVAHWVTDRVSFVYDADYIGEKAVLEKLARHIGDAGMGSHYKVATFNGREFDWPFFIRRCWFHGVTLPQGILTVSGRWIDWPAWMIDLRDLWGLGQSFPKGSLSVIGDFLGIGHKAEDGSRFHERWRGNPEERAQAVAYLHNEAFLMRAITERLLSLSPNQYGLKVREEHDSANTPRHGYMGDTGNTPLGPHD